MHIFLDAQALVSRMICKKRKGKEIKEEKKKSHHIIYYLFTKNRLCRLFDYENLVANMKYAAILHTGTERFPGGHAD